MSLEDRLQATPPVPEHQFRRQAHKDGPSFEWNGNSGFIQTGPLEERPRTWDEFIKDSGLDPEEVEVEEPVQVRGWDAPKAAILGGGVVRMHYYRLTLRRRVLKQNIDDLIAAAVLSSSNASVSPSEAAQAYVIALGDLQLGKALADVTPMLTTRGWTTHGDIKPGDYVYGPDGKPKEVLGVTGSTEQNIYRVEFDRGVVIQATADHIWEGKRRFHPSAYRRVGGPTWEWRHAQMTTKELLEQPRMTGKTTSNRALHVDLPDPIYFEEKELPIDPYILGLWLGDGNSHTGIITLGSQDGQYIEHLGTHVPSNERDGQMCSIRVPDLTKKLNALGLIKSKSIPQIYLEGSIDQRLALLQGLMDTDGHCTEKGWLEFCNTNENLVQGVQWLFISLGFKVTIKSKIPVLNGVEHSRAWIIRATSRKDMPVFRFTRKLDRCHDGAQDWTRSRQIQRVVPDGRAMAQCLTVEGGLYLCGTDLVITHNCDGDGVEGTVGRFMESTARAVERYKDLRQSNRVGPVYLFHLGDCIEGFVSQGGNLAWRTTLTTTEQVRLYRRLLLEQVKAFAPLCNEMTVVGVPGNHDEAHRPLHTYGDSWAIDALSAVSDVAREVPGYSHVNFIAPERDELTITLDVKGTIVGLAHGHQWRAGQAEKWWADQAHGRQPIGDADILLSAHLHHLRVIQGGAKTWIQVPALESESTWWRHRAGQVAPPGIVTAVIGNGLWSSLEVL